MKHLLNCSWRLSKEENTRRRQVTFRRTIYEQISVKLYNTIYGVSETVSLGLVTRGTTITSTRRRWLIASITSGERFFLECWYSSNILLTVVVNSYLLEWNRRSTEYHLAVIVLVFFRQSFSVAHSRKKPAIFDKLVVRTSNQQNKEQCNDNHCACGTEFVLQVMFKTCHFVYRREFCLWICYSWLRISKLHKLSARLS